MYSIYKLLIFESGDYRAADILYKRSDVPVTRNINMNNMNAYMFNAAFANSKK